MTGAGASWRIASGRVLELDRPRIIGILNVTPDSFSDGGLHAAADAALRRVEIMVEQGAAMIDVGGESTRPGAARVDVETQIRRTAPIIESIRRITDLPISIDTTRSPVAEAALDAGADVVNDVAAGREDGGMLDLVAERGCGYVLMHRRAPPGDDSYSDRYDSAPVYEDVVAAVIDVWSERCAAAVARGVDRASLVVDPGLGFGKSVEQNFELIRRTGELMRWSGAASPPMLSAASRKSFIGAASGVDSPAERRAGSVAVSVCHWLAGVRLFRVHDVAAHREALSIAASIAPPAEHAAGG